MKGQPLYRCLTLHNGIWKTIKRKINPGIKIRQIVKLNDKCTGSETWSMITFHTGSSGLISG